ncbi:MAG: BatD family protein, partial [Candidatus Eisenbacteria bacterium]
MRRLRCASVLVFLLAAGPLHAATQVQARLSASRVDVGGSVTLLVTATDASSNVRDPSFEVPDGLEVLGRDRSQNFSWINGRSSSEVQFSFELGAMRAGRYAVGPIRVSIGNQTFLSDAMPLDVTAPRPQRIGGGGRSPASLYVSISPTDPYVGQLVQLRVQFVQRASLAEDSQYLPPGTPGFWTEAWSEPRNREANEGGRNVIVIERAQRIYPLAAGRATVGQAQALVTPAIGSNPYFGGGGMQRLTIASDSFRVSVRPLPAGAPAGFAGAVGRYAANWVVDRAHTAEDQAVTVHLDVRGIGGLPLLQTPVFSPPDFETFASTSEDSLSPAGSASPGRRSFVWTLLPKRSGTLRIPAPPFAWFDPELGLYRQLSTPPLSLEVLSASGASSKDPSADRFPLAFAEHGVHAGGRAAWAWLAAISGMALGIAIRLWRGATRPDAHAGERAMAREYLRAVGFAKGPDFWRAAEQSATWLEAMGKPVLRLREDIAAARYGGQIAAEDDIRRRLVERLGETVQAEPSPTPRRTMATGLTLLSMVALWIATPQPGPERFRQLATQADALARQGQMAAAEAGWRRLWDEAPGDAALAARLGWARLQDGDLAGAVRWTLLGAEGEPREAALRWTEARAREAGGLVGTRVPSLPLRSLEWAVLAFAFALGLALAWPRRLVSAVLLSLTLLAAVAVPVAHRAAASRPLF